jgi:hypothetical protein
MKINRRAFINLCSGDLLDSFWKVRPSFPILVNLEPMPNKALHPNQGSARKRCFIFEARSFLLFMEHKILGWLNL